VRDLAGSSAKRLDAGVQTASDSARAAFAATRKENVEQLAVVA
jgi:hypothetical protein